VLPKDDVFFCFDLELPWDFEPVAVDGEVRLSASAPAPAPAPHHRTTAPPHHRTTAPPHHPAATPHRNTSPLPLTRARLT
jgi:hypothetical protein